MKTIEVKERFINFIEIHGKKSEDITNSILKSLEDNGLDIHGAVNILSENFAAVLDVLEELSEQADNQETRSKAYSIINLISRFEFISLLYFWKIILAKINRVQKQLQDKSMIFCEASKDINNLKIFFSEERDNIIKDTITKSTKSCIELQISTERRIRVRKHIDGESRNVDVVSYTQELSRAMFSIIDRIISEFNNRFLILDSLILMIDSAYSWIWNHC